MTIPQPLPFAAITIIDLETTGLNHRTDAIIELAAVTFRGAEPVASQHTLVNPGRPIPAKITALTGITDVDVAAAPQLAEVLPAFLANLHGKLIAAHNAAFDLAFLAAASNQCAAPWPALQVVDTLTMARLVLPKPVVPDHRLSTLSSYFYCANTPRHRALADVHSTAAVLSGLCQKRALTFLNGSWHLPCRSTDNT